MRFALICGAVACALVGLMNGHQSADYFLDLVDAPRSTDAETQLIPLGEFLTASSMQRPMVTDTANTPLPCTTTLISMDKSAYTLGDQITYQVLIRNAGTVPMTIPTSTRVHLFRRTMPGAIMAVLGLAFEDEVLGLQRFATETLYGSNTISGSTVTLQPKQTIALRTRQKVTILGPVDAPTAWARPVEVRAEFSLYPRSEAPHGDATSTNSLSVEISRVQPRR